MNKRVPYAVLCCFTIAFILQGVLKLCGILVFDKALSWEIFALIDGSLVGSIIYYSLFVLLAMYCLTFTLHTRAYSKQWYHYVILIVFAFGITALKFLTNTAQTTTTPAIDIFYDIVLYIGVPLLIYFTTPKENRLFKSNSLTNIVIVIMLQILLYFTYLGLNYWSTILTSCIPLEQYIDCASAAVLVQLEVYIGLVTIMLSVTILLNKLLKEDTMHKPINIATDEAKKAELARVKAEKEKKAK